MILCDFYHDEGKKEQLGFFFFLRSLCFQQFRKRGSSHFNLLSVAMSWHDCVFLCDIFTQRHTIQFTRCVIVWVSLVMINAWITLGSLSGSINRWNSPSHLNCCHPSLLNNSLKAGSFSYFIRSWRFSLVWYSGNGCDSDNQIISMIYADLWAVKQKHRWTMEWHWRLDWKTF